MGVEALYAYAAGVLDGDGYFSVVRDESASWGSSLYRIKMGIKQLWPGPALRFISSHLGGEVCFENRGKRGRPIARWELYSSQAQRVILSVLPYLMVKRSQALQLYVAQELLEGCSTIPGLWAVLDGLRKRVIMTNRGTVPGPFHADPLSSQPDVAGKERPPVRKLNALPYLAGIMDSDGNFKIERKRVKGMLAPHYRIAIRASQVAPSPAIDLLAQVFGGTVRVRDSGGAGHRPLAYWSLHDRSAVPAIAALLPYLVTKAPEAALLLRLRQLKEAGKEGLTEHVHANRRHARVVMRKRCYSADQVQAMDRLYLTLRALHSGVEPLALPGFPVPKRGRLRQEEVDFLRSAC